MNIMTVTEQQQHKDPNKGIEIRILTLNVWGIPFFSKDRKARIEAITQQLNSTHEPYHFVFFQEVWSKEDYRLIAEKVSTFLPHSHYFYSGLFGSGVCIFSCTPISEVHYHPYSLNGYPHKFHHADWFGGKGVAMCRTTFQGVPLLLINTHLHAQYDSKNDEYIHHRVVQGFELSQLLRFTTKDFKLAICCGDFNTTPNDVTVKLLTHNSGLVDTFSDCPSKPADGVGATNETPSNSYTSLGALKDDPNGKRIDYIMYLNAPDYQVRTRVLDQPWPPRVPQREFSFSDHEAVRAVINIRPRQQGIILEMEDSSPSDTICFNRTDALLDASAVCTQGLRMVNRSRRLYTWFSFILAMTIFTFVCFYYLQMSSTGQFFFTLFLLFLLCCLMFCSFYAFLFSRLEYNAVLAAKMGLERLLEEVRIKNAQYFEEQKKKTQAGFLSS